MTLDRLFNELIEAVQADVDRRGDPVTVYDLQHSLIPYRRVRDRLALECSEDHEMLLLRLCAGEGGFVTLHEAKAQEAFLRETGEINPDLAVLSTYATVAVDLNLASGKASDPAQTMKAYRPPGERDNEEDAAGGQATVIAFTPLEDPPGLPTPPPIPEPTPVDPAPVETTRDVPPDITFEIAPDDAVPEDVAEDVLPTCGACGGEIPTNRRVSFCPHCGRSRDASRCLDCDAVLEPGWRHCVECGRPTSPT
jgi:hypothetical protein